jgi:hypothetical protein
MRHNSIRFSNRYFNPMLFNAIKDLRRQRSLDVDFRMFTTTFKQAGQSRSGIQGLAVARDKVGFMLCQ